MCKQDTHTWLINRNKHLMPILLQIYFFKEVSLYKVVRWTEKHLAEFSFKTFPLFLLFSILFYHLFWELFCIIYVSFTSIPPYCYFLSTQTENFEGANYNFTSLSLCTWQVLSLFLNPKGVMNYVRGKFAKKRALWQTLPPK